MKGIEFKDVFCASGTRNFFGQGWWFHRYYRWLFGKRFDFSGATLVTKTTTIDEREGNMPLNKNWQPKEWTPQCMVVKFAKGVILNSVGLSGPGAGALFGQGIWQRMTDPFLISFMSVADTTEGKIEEATRFAKLLKGQAEQFQTGFGLQLNVSCPNTGEKTSELIKEAVAILEVFRACLPDLPIDLKVNALATVEMISEIDQSGLCDRITCSNAIPWGQFPEFIKWNELFGTDESPLAHFGGGGLSGWPLLPIVANWINMMRQSGITLPIKAGGGIMNCFGVDIMAEAGADAIEIGSVAILRPWRVAKIIRYANMVFCERRNHNVQNA